MQKPKVYFTSFKTSFTENIPDKLKRLILTAGVKEIDFTFWGAGEPGIPAPKLCKSGCRCSEGIGWESIPHRLQYLVCGKQEECAGPP